MNKLERELKLLFGESELFSEAVFCGKTMIGKLDKDVRAKIEFISTGVHKHYDSLKVTILNRTEGIIDTTVFNFSDMIGLKNERIPYYWDEPNCNGWYGFKMTSDDYDQISDTIHDYMSMFAEEDIGYEMRTINPPQNQTFKTKKERTQHERFQKTRTTYKAVQSIVSKRNKD